MPKPSHSRRRRADAKWFNETSGLLTRVVPRPIGNCTAAGLKCPLSHHTDATVSERWVDKIKWPCHNWTRPPGREPAHFEWTRSGVRMNFYGAAGITGEPPAVSSRRRLLRRRWPTVDRCLVQHALQQDGKTETENDIVLVSIEANRPTT